MVIKILRFKSCLFHCFLHSISTTQEKTTSYKRSAKNVTNATAEVEEEQEIKRRKEGMVARKSVKGERTAVILSLTVPWFKSRSVEIGAFVHLIACGPWEGLCIISTIYCSH